MRAHSGLAAGRAQKTDFKKLGKILSACATFRVQVHTPDTRPERRILDQLCSTMFILQCSCLDETHHHFSKCRWQSSPTVQSHCNGPAEAVPGICNRQSGSTQPAKKSTKHPDSRLMEQNWPGKNSNKPDQIIQTCARL